MNSSTKGEVRHYINYVLIIVNIRTHGNLRIKCFFFTLVPKDSGLSTPTGLSPGRKTHSVYSESEEEEEEIPVRQANPVRASPTRMSPTRYVCLSVCVSMTS